MAGGVPFWLRYLVGVGYKKKQREPGKRSFKGSSPIRSRGRTNLKSDINIEGGGGWSL